MRLSPPSFALLVAMAGPLQSQDRDAAALHLLMNGLTVTTRVLVIGVHPEDEDTQLIAWLSRGRAVETAYLSLTRGEAGQNLTGAETGGVLGAVRTQELLAARRIDGAEVFFTRAFDFGPSKNANETFDHWPHQDILGDIVAVIRAFRPHVIVADFPDTLADGDGQHQAMGILAREAFDVAGDTIRFPASTIYGHAWVPLKLYRHGAGLTIDAGEYDAVLGRSYADIASEARSQYRSQGFVGAAGAALRRSPRIELQRVTSRVNDGTQPVVELSIFDGIDTSAMRLIAGAPDAVARAIPSIVADADSARGALDLEKPGGIVHYLAGAARRVTIARAAAPQCQHPSPDAAMAATSSPACDGRALDLEASLDLMQRRITSALLLASGVSFDAAADRELLANVDTVPVTVTMHNRGTTLVTLADIVVFGALHTAMAPIVVPPDSAAREIRFVTGLPNSRPWWIGKRVADLYPLTVWPIDGLDRGELLPNAPLGRAPEPARITLVVTATGVYSVPGVALPETIRRQSDVTVTVTIDGATVTTSLGPVLSRYADPVVGAQARPVSGVPPVTLSFGGALEWIAAHKPITRPIRLAITSFSDREQSFKLNFLAPQGMRLDSVPASHTLAPHEKRDLFLHVRGMLDTGRHIFGAIANARNGARYTTGFQTVQYPHIPPIHVFRNSALYLQAVDIVIPAGLTVLYVQGSGDDIAPALKQVGVSAAVVTADDFPGVDLAQVSTVVIGERAYDAYPQLVDQTARLMEFARKGGTVVVLQHLTIPSHVLPYPLSLVNVRPVNGVALASAPRPTVESVAPDVQVTVLDPKARLLNWPNVLRADDWSEWVRDRAQFVPPAADPRYSTIVEMLDRDNKPNRNTLLVAPVGKGAYVYTTLSFGQQIPAGVPGALRLFVNLLSAGVPRDGRSGLPTAP